MKRSRRVIALFCIWLIFSISFVHSYQFIGMDSAYTIQNTHLSCDDTDAGKDIYKKGVVTRVREDITGNNVTDVFEDFCYDADTVAEKYCVGTGAYSEYIDCPGSCSDGECAAPCSYTSLAPCDSCEDVVNIEGQWYDNECTSMDLALCSNSVNNDYPSEWSRIIEDPDGSHHCECPISSAAECDNCAIVDQVIRDMKTGINDCSLSTAVSCIANWKANYCQTCEDLQSTYNSCTQEYYESCEEYISSNFPSEYSRWGGAGNPTCSSSCTSHSYHTCYDGDEYWYDSCGNKEERKQDCGYDNCGSWTSNYCKDNDVYHSRICYDRGCSGSSCFQTSSTDEQKVADCPDGCSDGQCIEAEPCPISDASECTTCAIAKSVTDAFAQGSCDSMVPPCVSNLENFPYEYDKFVQESSLCPGEPFDICCVESDCPIISYSDCDSCEVLKESYEECKLGIYSECKSHISSHYPDEYSRWGGTSNPTCSSLCTSHASYSCYNGNVYWYDSCGAREGVKEYCSNLCDDSRCIDCLAGDCCDTSTATFRDSNYKCKSDKREYGCYDGTDMGDDVYRRYVTQWCSGNSTDCDGRISATEWRTEERCGRDEYCEWGEDDCQDADCDEDCRDWHRRDDVFKYRKCTYFNDDCELADVVVVKYDPDDNEHACDYDSDCCGGIGECMEYGHRDYDVCVFDDEDWDHSWECITPPDYEPDDCDIPDGSSWDCTCDSDHDCPSSHPYCQAEYPYPISEGPDACLENEPSYCGDGVCGYGEDYISCNKDCPGGTGKLYISVTQDRVPIGNALVKIDDRNYGRTDDYGNILIGLDYGYYEVTACCPDGTGCYYVNLEVDGEVNFTFTKLDCVSHPPTDDSDEDGMTDDEEDLLGTDPYDASENLASVLRSNEISTGCFDLRPLFSGILSVAEKDRLLQKLGEFSSQEMKPLLEYDRSAIKNILDTAGIDESDIIYSGETLSDCFLDSSDIEYVQDGVNILLIVTNEYGETSVFPIVASCSGNIVGLLSGAAIGIRDDAQFVYVVVKGLWYYATHMREILDIWDNIKNFFGNFVFPDLGDIFRDVSISILEKGKGVLDFFGISPGHDEYLSYQMGFYQGYVVGYVTEQVLLLGKVAEAFKALKLGAQIGQTASRVIDLLTDITKVFGGHVADALRSLRVWKVAQTWSDDIVHGLAMMVDLHGADVIQQATISYGDDVIEAASRTYAKVDDARYLVSGATDVKFLSVMDDVVSYADDVYDVAGTNGLKGIKVLRNSDELYFNPNDKIIYMGESAARDKLRYASLYHEYAHADIIYRLGVAENIVDDYDFVLRFDELCADMLAKQKLSGSRLSDFVRTVKNTKLSLTQSGIADALNNKHFDELVWKKSLALELGDSSAAGMIDDAILNYNAAMKPDFDNLVQKFRSYSNLEGVSSSTYRNRLLEIENDVVYMVMHY